MRKGNSKRWTTEVNKKKGKETHELDPKPLFGDFGCISTVVVIVEFSSYQSRENVHIESYCVVLLHFHKRTIYKYVNGPHIQQQKENGIQTV